MNRRGTRPTPSRGRRNGRSAVADSARSHAAPLRARVEQVRIVEIPATITVRELADRMGIGAVEIIKELLKNGILANINQVIDYDTAVVVAGGLGYEVKEPATPTAEVVASSVEELRQRRARQEQAKQAQPRPPVVTIMGHVDHGKTSLLDAIRSTNVTASEYGGITQHIGAYQVEVDGQKITFLDTPGHEAFTAMRARGARVTDIAVIVVAADDGVMPQTVEAINHAKAAGVPLVVAINKIDKPEANPERAKRELAERGVLIEEWGGDVVCVSVSAKAKQGIPDLLENLLLVAEIQELKANPERPAEGVVLEAQLDTSRGPMATVLVHNGTLSVGDVVVAGNTMGRVKAMFNDRSKAVKRAGPSTPVKILGLSAVPQAGDVLTAMPDEKAARAVLAEQERSRAGQEGAPVTLQDLYNRIQTGQVKELDVVLKTDVHGSIEPIRSSLEKLGNDKVRVKVLHMAPGTITESDVMLALASKGIVIGFNTRPEPGARRLAEQEGVEIRQYHVIYELAQDIEKALSGLLEPVWVDVVDGHGEVRKVFRLGKHGAVAGTYVRDGKITRNSTVRVLRGKEALAEDKVASLRRGKDDVREVAAGYECGIGLENFHDFQEGDLLEFAHKERR
ncbi:MAG: translation initiation factor IF-2 [Chloroflexi bacterium]|nr:translation initiation factor IF-2 [Chloroflexota bacterium]